MKSTDKQDGKYANIGCTPSGMFWGEIYEIQDGIQFNPEHATQDFTPNAVKFWLHEHGVSYDNISIVENN